MSMRLNISFGPNVSGGRITSYMLFARLERDGADPIDFGGNLDGSVTVSKKELRELCLALLAQPPVQVNMDGDLAVFEHSDEPIPVGLRTAEGDRVLGRGGYER